MKGRRMLDARVSSSMYSFDREAEQTVEEGKKRREESDEREVDGRTLGGGEECH